MGIMKNLVDQNTDSMNKARDVMNTLQTTLQKQQSDSGAHVDQLSGQIQSLNDTMDELKARLGQGQQAIGRHAVGAAESGRAAGATATTGAGASAGCAL